MLPFVACRATRSEQGKLAILVPEHLYWCMLCSTQAAGDEPRYVVCDCPHFALDCRQLMSLYQDGDGAMQSFAWHQDQKSGCHYLAAVVTLANDSGSHYSFISQCWLDG